MPEMSRRAFLQVAAGGGAALAADRAGKTVGRLVAPVQVPRDARPGVWTVYATTCRECPAGSPRVAIGTAPSSTSPIAAITPPAT
jgi:anaerobic selenocysteine-containing dehydrogenase